MLDNNYPKVNKNEVKNSISIEALAGYFASNGISLHREGNQFRSNGSRSLSIHLDESGLPCFHDFSGGQNGVEGGDIFSAITYVEGISDFKRQLERACEISGLRFETVLADIESAPIDPKTCLTDEEKEQEIPHIESIVCAEIRALNHKSFWI